MAHGIDYSGPGSLANRNPDTGIRYGIVSVNEMSEWFWDSVESEWDNFCPKCGNELSDDEMPEYPEGPCPHCEETISPDDTTGDEPSGNVIDTNGIKGFVDSSNDVWIVESPFYTRGVFCSPCAPGGRRRCAMARRDERRRRASRLLLASFVVSRRRQAGPGNDLSRVGR